MATKLTWNGDAFEKHLKKATADSLRAATILYHTLCRRAVSVTNPRNRDTGEYDSPSEPGEAPRLRTGFGRAGIVWEFDEENIEGRVGVTANALYMFYLEIGTKHIARRPWLLITLMSNQDAIGLVAATPASESDIEGSDNAS